MKRSATALALLATGAVMLTSGNSQSQAVSTNTDYATGKIGTYDPSYYNRYVGTVPQQRNRVVPQTQQQQEQTARVFNEYRPMPQATAEQHDKQNDQLMFFSNSL